MSGCPASLVVSAMFPSVSSHGSSCPPDLNVRVAGGLESTQTSLQRLTYNERISHFETDLLDLPHGKHDHDNHGIPGREQFKHVIFGPQAWRGGVQAQFPAVRDALDKGDWEGAQRMVERAAAVLKRAGEKLVE